MTTLENGIIDRLDRIITLLEWHQNRITEADKTAARAAVLARRAQRRAKLVIQAGALQAQNESDHPTDADPIAA